MKTNVGTQDKIIRILIASIIGFLVYQGILTGTLATVLLVLGTLISLSTIIGFCPLYIPLGINTCARR